MRNTKKRWRFVPAAELKNFRIVMLLVSALMLLALIMLRQSAYLFSHIFSPLFAERYSDIINSRSGSLSVERDLLNAYYDLISIAVSVSTFVVISLFLRLIYRRTNREGADLQRFRLKIPHRPLRYIVVGFALFYLFFFISEYILALLAQFVEIDRQLSPDFGFPGTIAGVLLHITATAVVPAVFEELTFRYFLLNILKRYGNVFAIIVSSVFFGLLHASYNAFFYAAAFGAIAAHAAIKSKSIALPIIMHFAINFASVLFSLTKNSFGEQTLDLIFSIFLSFLAVAFAIITVISMRRNPILKLPADRNEIFLSAKTKSIWTLNIFTLLFAVLAICYSLDEFIPF